MFSLDGLIDLPLVWGVLIATAVLLYVLLDGFDLGVGILFPHAPTADCRDRLMHSIAPFWDGNETWLVMGGGGLFAAFPLAYAILMPAFYLPLIIMLLCLVFRGVAFEFRFKADRSRPLWDRLFHLGSLGAAFMQGVILGGLVQGVAVAERAYAGGPFDWLSPFSLMTGVALVCGYVLLGATWLIWKTEPPTQDWARRLARRATVAVAVFMGVVSLWAPLLDNGLAGRWQAWLFYLAPLPLLSLILFAALWRALAGKREWLPFVCALGLFLLAFAGLIASFWPWIVPYQVSLAAAAAAPASQSFLLVGAVLLLPVILTYTGLVYYVFRGKASVKHEY